MRSEKKYKDGFYSIGMHLLLKYVHRLRGLDVCVVCKFPWLDPG